MPELRKYQQMVLESLPPEELWLHTYRCRVAPFSIAGNVWYVGDRYCSCLLIDSGDGLILLDTPYPPSSYLVLQSIWELGFDPKNIRYILHTHAHTDHYGCTVPFTQLFGCKTLMGETDAQALDKIPGRVDAAPEGKTLVPQIDIRLKDGDVFECGRVKIHCMLTPGHTPGLMSYFWDTEEAGKHYTCGMFGGSGFNTLCKDYLEDYSIGPQIREQFIDSLDRAMGQKVDINIGNHPMQNNMFGKAAGKRAGGSNPFIDPSEWARFLQGIKERFLLFLEEEREKL